MYAITSDLPKGPLDVILHSPGGTAEATEAIVSMLRARFDHIRFIVPLAAKSTATMLALSGDEIVGDTTTELGPIDPQFRLLRADVVVNAPAFAILEQWAKAGAEIAKDRATLVQWIPILNQYGPSLLVECEQQIKTLSVELVAKWLTDYMLKGEPDAKKTATALAEYLGDWRNFGSHSRAVSISDIAARGAKGAVMLEEGCGICGGGLVSLARDIHYLGKYRHREAIRKQYWRHVCLNAPTGRRLGKVWRQRQLGIARSAAMLCGLTLAVAAGNARLG